MPISENVTTLIGWPPRNDWICFRRGRKDKRHELLSAVISGGTIALHPDRRRFTVAVGRFEYDIHLLEGFQMPRRRFWVF